MTCSLVTAAGLHRRDLDPRLVRNVLVAATEVQLASLRETALSTR